MEISHIVFLVLVFVAVVVVASYLIFVVVTLHGVYHRLNSVLASVDEVTQKTLPTATVIGEINRDLGTGRDALEGCVERLKARQVPAAAPGPTRYP